MNSSTPSFSEFDPDHIPMQRNVIDAIYNDYDYSLGTHQILLSGSVGSSKSILMAHLTLRHMFEFNRSRILLGRKALPDLKDTIFNKILEHIEQPNIKRDVHYYVNETSAKIRFRNGSEIISRSWSDKKYKKLRSLELSAAVIEELTENNLEDKQAFDEIKMRVGRLPHVPHKWIISATNPDSPRHLAYKEFFLKQSQTSHVFLSRTEDNPFLPKEYIAQLKEDMDQKTARRMLYGEWVELDQERIYYAYQSDRNFKKYTYLIRKDLPLRITWDFNIGEGKPMSVALMQYWPETDEYHLFDEVVMFTARTQNILEEIASRNYFDDYSDQKFIIHGDASGKNSDTRNNKNDYQIIREFLENYTTKQGKRLIYEFKVALKNPEIRKRHNIVNAYCFNSNEKIRLFVYQKCNTIDEGLRLTTLKKGADYIEDDSKNCPYQHITTAIGYAICFNKYDNDAGTTTIVKR